MTTRVTNVLSAPCNRLAGSRWWLAIILLVSWSTLALAEKMALADPKNGVQVARGQTVYMEQCASCHGADLKGHPDWMKRLPSGRLPPPPHDATGHTWHHPDDLLFGMIQRGVAAYAWKGYESDMPAFGSILSDDDIWAVLAYLKSTWPEEVRTSQSQRTEQARQRTGNR